MNQAVGSLGSTPSVVETGNRLNARHTALLATSATTGGSGIAKRATGALMASHFLVTDAVESPQLTRNLEPGEILATYYSLRGKMSTL